MIVGTIVHYTTGEKNELGQQICYPAIVLDQYSEHLLSLQVVTQKGFSYNNLVAQQHEDVDFGWHTLERHR